LTQAAVLTLALLVSSIGIADSINPSTVVPALWLASAPRGRGLGSYTLAVFLVYLLGGMVLVFGPGPTLIHALHHVRGSVEHGLLAAGGVVALVFAFALWHSRRSGAGVPRPRRSYTPRSAFMLGAGIMAVELPTAFMYFGAITAILAARPDPIVESSLLVLYCALFVVPLVAIAAVKRVSGARADRWLESGEAWLRRAGSVVLGSAAGGAGAILLVIGISGLLGS
jgi:hypothetical protein